MKNKDQQLIWEVYTLSEDDQMELAGMPEPIPLTDEQRRYLANMICDLARTYKRSGMAVEESREWIQKTFEESSILKQIGWIPEVQELTDQCLQRSYRN